MARTTTLSGTVLWSNGTPFDGYVLLAYVLPDGYGYAAVSGVAPKTALPTFTKVPIVAGAPSQTVHIYFNADLEPPNTRYAAWWYDTQDTLVAGPSAVFDIATVPYAIVVPSLIAPSASSTVPDPPSDDVIYVPPAVVGSGTVAGVWNEVTPSGVVNGSNTTFTLPGSPSLLFLFLNGLKVSETVDYTLGGSTITMATAPLTGDTLRAVYLV